MALIDCPECGRQVSSAAASCPNCGHPILQTAAVTSGHVAGAAPGDVPTTAMEPRALSFGLSGTVAGFLWASAVGFAVAALLAFWALGSWVMWVDGEISSWDAADAESIANMFTGFAFLGVSVAWVLFIIWFFQAYRSAASRGASGVRWGTGWTIGAWFIPFANWVIPKLVMNEVDRMSNPLAGEPPIGERWKRMSRLAVSDVWWISYLMAVALQLLGWVVIAVAQRADDDAYGMWLLVIALMLVLYSISFALMGVTTLKIGKRLRQT